MYILVGYVDYLATAFWVHLLFTHPNILEMVGLPGSIFEQSETELLLISLNNQKLIS